MPRLTLRSFFLFASLLTTRALFCATTYQWVGGTSGNWTDNTKWSPNLGAGNYPGSAVGDTAQFLSLTSNATTAINLNVPITINTFLSNFPSTNAFLAINGSNTLSFESGGAITVSATGTGVSPPPLAFNIPLGLNTTCTFTNNVTHNTAINNGMTGNSTLLCTGTGTGLWEFAGSALDSFTGDMTITGATWLFTKVGTPALQGNVNITPPGATTASLELNVPEQFPTTCVVTIDGTNALLFCNPAIGNNSLDRLVFNNGTVTQNGQSFTIAGTGNGTAISMRNTTISGPIIINGGTVGSGGITFDATNNGTATFSSTSSLDLGSQNRTFTIGPGSAAIDMNVACVISSSGGGVTVNGNTGTLQFSGTSANTYSGPTTVTQGTLQLNKTANVISLPSTSVTVNGGTLQLLTANQINSGASATVSSGTFNLNGNAQTLSSLTYSGGTTTIGAGNTLSLSSGSTALTMGDTTLANGTVSFTGGSSGNDILFNGATGSTIGSNLDLGSAARTFNIGNVAGIAMNVTGVISNGAGITKSGGGTLQFSGANTYPGVSTISTGTLQAGATNTFSPNSDYTINAGATLALQTFNQTIGLLSGAGNVTLAATLTTGTSSDSTFSGNMSGTGSLNKQGSGILFLTGGPNAIGSATVSQGRLAVNNALATTGGLTVSPGASLGGVGTITSNILVQGTLSPGNSIGMLHVTGAVTQASGSIFDVELQPSGSTVLHDELDIIGSYTINPGATLLIEPSAGIYPSHFEVTIVDALPGQLFGQFSTVTVTLPTFSVNVFYETAIGDIVLANFSLLPFSTVVTKGNAGAVAACIDTLPVPSGSDIEAVIAELRMIPTVGELAQALARLQPSQFTALALAQENTVLYTSDSVFYRLRQITESCPIFSKESKKRMGFWITPYGGFANQREKNEQPGFNTIAGGVTTGFDVNPWEHWIVGGALGYSYDHLKWREGFGHANIQDGFGAFYTGCSGKHAYLFGTLLGSYDHYNTTRHIQIGDDLVTDVNRNAKGAHNGWHASGHLQAGLLFGKKVQFSPFVQANYLYIHETSFNEHGAESLSLHVQKKNSDLLEGEAGFEIARCFSAATNHFSPFAGFSVIREWRFTGKQMKSSFKGSSCVMRTTGMNPDRTLYSPTAGLTFLLPNENQTLSFEYKGKFGEKFHDNRFLAQFLIKF